jgi:hypothetical protein
METYTSRVVMEQAGYRRERLPNGVLILRLMDARKETIEAWYEDCSRLMTGWRPERRLRYLHDIRRAELVTPHATERVTRVLRRMRTLPVTDARGAILLHSETLAALLGSFLRRRSEMGWDIRFFSDEGRAVRWLSESPWTDDLYVPD